MSKFYAILKVVASVNIDSSLTLSTSCRPPFDYTFRFQKYQAGLHNFLKDSFFLFRVFN